MDISERKRGTCPLYGDLDRFSRLRFANCTAKHGNGVGALGTSGRE